MNVQECNVLPSESLKLNNFSIKYCLITKFTSNYDYWHRIDTNADISFQRRIQCRVNFANSVYRDQLEETVNLWKISSINPAFSPAFSTDANYVLQVQPEGKSSKNPMESNANTTRTTLNANLVDCQSVRSRPYVNQVPDNLKSKFLKISVMINFFSFMT